MSVSDRFSFLREWQKEAVRSEELNSKAREFCNKKASSVKEDDKRSLVSAHEGTITVRLAYFKQTMGQLRKN